MTDDLDAAEMSDVKAEADEVAPAKAKAKPKATKRAAPKAKPSDPLDVPLFDSAGERQGEVRLPKVIFAEKVNTPVMHQAFVRQVVFGPHPRSYAQRMPKQMRRLALRSAITQKATEGRVRVIDGFAIEEPRTSVAVGLMDAIGFDDTTLVVLPAPNFVVSRSFENLPGIKIILARNLNIRDLFTHTYLLLAKDCLELIEENFSRPERPKAGHGEHGGEDDHLHHGDPEAQ